MAVTDKKMLNTANTAKQLIDFTIVTSLNQAGVKFAQFTPGYRYKVVKVSTFAVTVTATISLDVQINGTSVLSGGTTTPVAATETAATLVADTGTSLLGGATDPIQVKLTTNGTGAATNLSVFVTIRPFPMDNDGLN